MIAITRLQKREGEFSALCKEYGYLQNAYFQRVPDPGHPGVLADADKIILAQASAQMSQRIAQLAMSGHSAEAQALATQLTQQEMQMGGSVADWNGWVGVLRHGDAVGYRTWVMIPTHPGTW